MRQRRPFLASLLLAALAAPPARALLTFENANPYAPPDLVTVKATESFGYDTNVFAQQIARGSTSESFSCALEYLRRAGIIQVSFDASLTSVYYGSLQQQNYESPDFVLTFTKGTGRTTGSFQLTASKTDTPDPIANDRAISWNYGADLSLRYPVMGRYYLTNDTALAGTYYTNLEIFSDLDSYADTLAVNYKYDSKLDLDGQYRFDFQDTDNTRAIDQALLFGAHGSVTSRWSGSLNLGYDYRASYYTDAPYQPFAGLTASGDIDWRMSRATTFTFIAQKDFSISSTDITTDTDTLGVSMDASLGRRLRTVDGLDYIATDFLGLDSDGRRDKLWEFTASLQTPLTTHTSLALEYAYYLNSSTLSTATFRRQTITLTINAEY